MAQLLKESQMLPVKKLPSNFFKQDCIALAKSLLGQLLVHEVDGKRTSGFIVETECYLGVNDGACHSYQGRRTARTEPMFMKPGTSYVYPIYGMYYCINISAEEEGSCVLIRGLQPLEDIPSMQIRRQARRKNIKSFKTIDLTNGPSKLCQALAITKTCTKLDMAINKSIWIEEGPTIPKEDIVVSTRIGIDSTGPEWVGKPWRFYVYGNVNVSARDKVAESELNELKNSAGNE